MQNIQIVLILALFIIPDTRPAPALKGDIVKRWARNLGDELWKLNEALTKSDQIRTKYKQMNASVKKKNGNLILESSLRSVSTMLTRKINAVRCIHATAEKLAKEFDYTQIQDSNFTFDYCSAKYSIFNDEELNEEELPKFVESARPNYENVSLENDSHFYHINVTTNQSCVHVPTNIYYKEPDALNAILWSKGLNEIFIQNYKSDPSLSWQYFGSSHGILRFYPGMPWNRIKTDTYDCRVKSWYIEAATCSKDVIILFDVSGSMTGFKNYIARRTLRSLLETLSNNDYVNVYYFKNNVSEVVYCFNGLVQATKENLNTIIDMLEPRGKDSKIHKYPLDGGANLTWAYTKAFETLKKRRGHCEVNSTLGCNQMVMVITDYVPGNLTEVFEEHNREPVNGRTYIPVRVFTYLIGKEVIHLQEIQAMACTNRGYFVHIHSVEEVQQQVLKYINVIARPMILNGSDPLPTWTHANIDDTRTNYWNVSGDVATPDEDKLVTSVAIPAFDYKYNENKTDARLLGVAGTDVPIDSIAKLAQPHQLGVNGYSFIVSNNGYLLLHPLLTTTINGKLQENYNSVDFVEVEQVDDGKGPRELGTQILELRDNLVHAREGSMMGIKVLYHYDKMRRISRVQHDYFFDKLEGTPFAMGISLPRGYGDTELLLKDNPLEAKQGKELTGINVTDYFRYNFRVHPDWVYCKYHYLEGHEKSDSEQEIWSFLVDLSENKIDITKKQYAEDSVKKDFNVSTHCGNATEERDLNDYYCNEDLMKQVVFDAKLTSPYFEKWNATQDERNLATEYNVTVRFVATSSGLTRWDYINDAHKNEIVNDTGYRNKDYDGGVFGDIYPRAIEETWYKAAVLQQMDCRDEALVIATRLPILDEIIENPPPVENEDGDITITASYAIFYKDGNSETPASVVGFEYMYSSFYDRFLELTELDKDTNEGLTCKDEKSYNCYIIDGSGYMVLSQDKSEVGQFFGTVQKLIMQSFVDKGIYDKVEVFNYQARCNLDSDDSSAWHILSPFHMLRNLLGWLFTETVILLYNWKDLVDARSIVTSDDPDYPDLIQQASTEAPPTSEPKNDTVEAKEDNKKPFSCDHQISLYRLNQTYFTEAMGASPIVTEQEGKCTPSYWAAQVPKTNLLLIVVKKTSGYFDEECPAPPDTKPVPTVDSTLGREPCHKLELGSLTRRRLEGCFTYHEGEWNITACGSGSHVRGDFLVLITVTLLALVISALR